MNEPLSPVGIIPRPLRAVEQIATNGASRIGLSIVVPVYRGANTIARLVGALSELEPEGGLEVVLVNDGSPDNSAEVCRNLLTAARVPLVYIEHARNYGEHNAVMTGLRHATRRLRDHDGRRPAKSPRGSHQTV